MMEPKAQYIVNYFLTKEDISRSVIDDVVELRTMEARDAVMRTVFNSSHYDNRDVTVKITEQYTTKACGGNVISVTATVLNEV